LGLYRDASPLLAENFDVMKDDRKWRTSRIDAFGSNVAFVLKKCKSSDPKDGKINFTDDLLLKKAVQLATLLKKGCLLDGFSLIFTLFTHNIINNDTIQSLSLALLLLLI
jgi:hypothetical protein